MKRKEQKNQDQHKKFPSSSWFHTPTYTYINPNVDQFFFFSHFFRNLYSSNKFYCGKKNLHIFQFLGQKKNKRQEEEISNAYTNQTKRGIMNNRPKKRRIKMNIVCDSINPFFL